MMKSKNIYQAGIFAVALTAAVIGHRASGYVQDLKKERAAVGQLRTNVEQEGSKIVENGQDTMRQLREKMPGTPSDILRGYIILHECIRKTNGRIPRLIEHLFDDANSVDIVRERAGIIGKLIDYDLKDAEDLGRLLGYGTRLDQSITDPKYIAIANSYRECHNHNSAKLSELEQAVKPGEGAITNQK